MPRGIPNKKSEEELDREFEEKMAARKLETGKTLLERIREKQHAKLAEKNLEKISDLVQSEVSEKKSEIEIAESKLFSDKNSQKVQSVISYPKAIMLTVQESFYDEDEIMHTYPAHKIIRIEHSIKTLVDRNASYVIIDQLDLLNSMK